MRKQLGMELCPVDVHVKILHCKRRLGTGPIVIFLSLKFGDATQGLAAWPFAVLPDLTFRYQAFFQSLQSWEALAVTLQC